MLASAYGYNTALSLTSTALPNAATATQTFDPATALLLTSKSVHGAVTNYSYSFGPTVVTAATNQHWTKVYKDGFGRDLRVETGTGTTVVSRVDSVYGPCACSPLGKLVQVSAP